MALTNGQQQAESMLKRFSDSDDSFAKVEGPPGTGKSFLTERIPSFIDPEKLLLCAPTHKALGTLTKMVGRPDVIESKTIHSFLGLGVRQVKDKQVSFRQQTYDPTENAHIRTVILDEMSMLDANLVNFIKQDVEEWGRRYILVGDHCQLPPVEGDLKISEAFGLALPRNSYTLDETVRQAQGNPIIKVAMGIREAILSGQEPDIKGGFNEDTGQGVILLRKNAWLDKMNEVVNTPSFHSDVDFCRTVAYTNAACKSHIRNIREMVGASPDRPFDEGDTVVVNSAYSENYVVILGTGTEVVVTSMTKGKHVIKGYVEWKVKLSTVQGIPLGRVFNVLDESARPEFDAETKRLKVSCNASGQWGPFYAHTGHYVDLRSPSALTAHKSQGSTFQNVFVDLADVYSNRRQTVADRCYYVALTRAAQSVYVLV